MRELQQVIPLVGCEPDARLFGILQSPAPFDIFGGDLVGRVQQILAEMLRAPLVDYEHRLALHACLFLLGSQPLFLDGYAVFLAEVPDGLRIAHRLVLHQETDGVAALATSETVPGAACRAHEETGGLLLVERAARLVIYSFLLQIDVTGYYIHNISTV